VVGQSRKQDKNILKHLEHKPFNEMNKQFNILFVGEEKSPTAIQKGWSWEDGRLAAKQLFRALDNSRDILSIDPKDCKFVNLFESEGVNMLFEGKLKTWSRRGIIVALGNKVSNMLDTFEIKHYKMVHPAARGSIRKKENYINHAREVLQKIKDDIK